MSEDTKVIQFISREDWEKQFAVESAKDGPVRLPRELNRRRVVSAFMDAFELVGGIPRLVTFASSNDENYATFLKLYARLLPSQSDATLDASTEKVIKHILPRSKLDE